MLRLLGAALVVAGLGWVGCDAAGTLRRRTAVLRELVGALERMERELEFCLTPLPDLFTRLSKETPAPLNGFFSACAANTQTLEQPFGEGWRQAAKALSGVLSPAALESLLRLGKGLGRYDSEGESGLLSATVAELYVQLERAEEDSRRRGKLYGTLGVTAGALLVILLI